MISKQKTLRKYFVRFSVRSRVEQTIWWTKHSKIYLSFSQNIFVWWILHLCVIRVPYLWLPFHVIRAYWRENEPKICITSEGNGNFISLNSVLHMESLARLSQIYARFLCYFVAHVTGDDENWVTFLMG